MRREDEKSEDEDGPDICECKNLFLPFFLTFSISLVHLKACWSVLTDAHELMFCQPVIREVMLDQYCNFTLRALVQVEK